MKLQQLKYLHAIVDNGLNITAAAEKLYTSQPGVSKQLKLLEEERGMLLLERKGKSLGSITPTGERVIERARNIMKEVDNIRTLASDAFAEEEGSLSIATTHTQARYALPGVIDAFIKKYPDVSLHMHQGSPVQIAELAAEGEVDFAIATEGLDLFGDLVMLPCYDWNRSIVVPKNHPLTSKSPLTLQDVADHPIVTYVFGFTGRSKLDEAFRQEGLEPKVVFTATDADVIKTYVRLGLGIGIIADMAHDEIEDSDLVALPASHLFSPSTTMIGCRRGTFLRGFMYDFIELFAPHLTRELVNQAVESHNRQEVDTLFAAVDLPVR